MENLKETIINYFADDLSLDDRDIEKGLEELKEWLTQAQKDLKAKNDEKQALEEKTQAIEKVVSQELGECQDVSEKEKLLSWLVSYSREQYHTIDLLLHP